MHEKVLETVAFPSFVFVPSKLERTVPVEGRGHVVLVGTLSIHGADHPLRLPADLEVAGDAVNARIAFPVPYVAWGMKNPSLLFLRVADEVAVKVEARGKLAQPVAVAGGTGGR